MLIEREQFHIDSKHSFDGKLGYNLSPTAGSQLGFTHSQETKDKLSKIQTGRSYADKVGDVMASEWVEKIRKSNTGKKRTQEMKDNISGVNNPMYGKTHTKSVRLQMSESMKGRTPWNKGKIVLKFTLDNEFIEEVSLDTLSRTIKPNVVKCCRGDRNKAAGFIWKYKDKLS